MQRSNCMQTTMVLSAAAIALAAPFLSAIQAQPAANGNNKLPSSEIVLPVTVRDKHGALVTDLQKGDLALTDEGKPESIKSLTRDSDLPFRIGLLVDTSRNMGGGMEAERKAADSFVDQFLPESSPSTRDQMFLIHFDREVELLEDFTNVREKLHRELESMGPTRQEKYEDQGPETTGDDRPRARGRNGKQLYDAIFLASDELMKSKDGRKYLVVFSDGADHGSKDTLNDAVDAADRANVSVYTIYFKGEEERSNTNSPGRDRRGGMGGGWPGGGGGYPGGYPGGGRRGGSPSETGVDGKKIMQQIATRTGGHAFEAKKTSDLEPIYKLIDQELHGQYLLTFSPAKAESDATFHKVALTTSKSDLTVVTREGYYPPGSDSSK